MTSLAEKVTPLQRFFIVASGLFSTTMVLLDTTVANVALSDIRASLSASPEQIAWVVTSYMVASAIGMPLWGAILERLGFRSVYIFCITGFALSSLLCGIATSLPELAFYRALQGLTGAAFMPMLQTLLMDIYPKEQMARAMSILGITTLFGPVIGPTLGGYLTDEVGWRWIFFINLPIAIAALAAMVIFLPSTVSDIKRQRFDYIGFGFFAIALASVQLVLDRGPGKDWFDSNEIIVYGLVAGLMFYFFIVHSAYRDQPFFNPALFRDRNFMSTLGVNIAVGVGMYGPLTLLPLYLQNIQYHTAFQTGLIMMPRAFVMSLPMLLMGRMLDRIDPRVVMFFGIICGASGLYLLAGLSVETPAWMVIFAGSLHAIGTASIFVPMNLIAFSTLEPHLRPMASSLMMLTRTFGASLGLAFLMGFISDSSDMNYLRLIENLSPFNPNMDSPWLPPMWSLDEPVLLKLMMLETTRQATVIAYDNAFLLLSILMLGTTLLLFVLGRGEQRQDSEPPVHGEIA